MRMNLMFQSRPSLMAALLLPLLSACTPAPAAVEVTENTPCPPLSLTVGQSLLLSLPATPSTGYSWTLKALPPILQHGGEAVFLPSPENERLGAAGQMRWRFTAHTPGTGTLALDYRRPWEQGVAPVRTFRCPLEVTE
jgi:inhibitor of cysteine peptidase